MDSYTYELLNNIQEFITKGLIIYGVLLIINVVVLLTVISWIRLTAKNTALTTNNIIELDKRQQERHEQLIATLQYQNKLLAEQNQQQPTAQQTPENGNT